MKRIRWVLLCCLLILLSGIAIHPWLPGPVWGILYDGLSGQQPVRTVSELDDVLQSLSTISYDSVLQTDYGIAQQLDTPVHRHRYRKQRFYVISGWERYRYLVGRHRIAAFLTPARMIGRRVPPRGWTQIFLIETDVLRRLLRLEQLLAREGHYADALTVTSAFRPPAYNELVGGKSRSRHLSGDALDVVIGDVNQDGQRDATDVTLVYDLLEVRVIRSFGGLGNYKSNEYLLHFDTRGRRARWSY